MFRECILYTAYSKDGEEIGSCVAVYVAFGYLIFFGDTEILKFGDNSIRAERLFRRKTI